VACRTIDLHVWLCLCSRVNHLSNAKIGNLNTLQLKQTLILKNFLF
jgi:hypothetical protein